MKYLLPFLLTGFVFFCQAQKKTDPVLFGNTIQIDDLKKHLYMIAGPEFEGRETATPGQQKTANYIQDYFQKIGLLPGFRGSYQMDFPVYQDSLFSIQLSINGNSFEYFKDFDAHQSSVYPSSLAAAEIVFVGYGISDSLQDDYTGLNVEGKLVLALNSYPPSLLREEINRKIYNPYAKQDAALRHGAVAVIVIQEDFPHRQIPLSNLMYRNFYRKKIRPNTIFISENIARNIMGDDYDLAKIGTLKPKKYNTDLHVTIQKQTRIMHSSDVLGYLEGTDLKDELLIISAHYDHLGKKDSVIYFGADDDGSGTVSLLEIAAAFAKAKTAGKGPRRSILFLANSGEEKGLWGSEYYTDHPAFPLEKTTADLNIDMIGRKDPARKQGDSNNYVFIVGDDKLSSELHTISIEANKRYTGLELDYKFNDPNDPLKIYYRSDHYNFARKGVPIIFYFDGINNDYHKPTDTPDKIDYNLMQKRARLIFYTAWEMANRNAMLKRDYPPVNGERRSSSE